MSHKEALGTKFDTLPDERKRDIQNVYMMFLEWSRLRSRVLESVATAAEKEKFDETSVDAFGMPLYVSRLEGLEKDYYDSLGW